MDCLFHIFFELFKKALLFGLGVVAAGFQLAKKLLLLFRQLRRRFDHDSDKLVAARLIPDIRNALAAQGLMVSIRTSYSFMENSFPPGGGFSFSVPRNEKNLQIGELHKLRRTFQAGRNVDKHRLPGYAGSQKQERGAYV